jgi:type I restriction enzyme S subunit
VSELPKGWSNCKLEDCVKILDSLRKPINNRERQVRVEGKSADELFPYYGATGKVGYIDDYLFDGEFVALGEDGVPFFDILKKKAYMLEGKTWVNNHAHVIKGADGVNNRYLYYYLNQVDYHGYVNGATRLKLTQANMRKLPVKLAPLNEQIRIADKLDSMLAKVDAAQARLDKIPNILKRFRQSVLAAATSGELTKEWRLTNSQLAYDLELLRQNIYDNWLEARHAEFKRKGKTPKSTSWLKKFPGPNFIDSMIPTWISLSLENIAEVVDPNPSHRMPSYVVEGKAFISSENIININKLNFSKGKKVTAEEVEKQKTRYEIVEGTFAFTRIGTIGKSVLLPKPHDYGISHAMAVVNPYKSIMDSAFLILTMNCETILKQASHGVQSVGVPDLGIGKMKSFTVPLPPLMEQQEIVRRVESLFTMVDTVEKQYKDAKARTNRLTQSILAKAFRGELVPQDDNDEPASELLARIKAASDNLTSKPKMAKKGSAK